MPAKRIALPTRAREYRKRKGLTLQQVAASIGTSAQTVQRLETGRMRMTLEWLEKLAQALEVDTGDLISARHGRAIEDLGEMASSGLVTPSEGGFADARPPLLLEVPARDPVSVRLTARIGPFQEGTILIGDRLPSASRGEAHGRYCLASLVNGPLLLRRVVIDAQVRIALVPYDGSDPVLLEVEVDWLAPLVLVLRYL